MHEYGIHIEMIISKGCAVLTDIDYFSLRALYIIVQRQDSIFMRWCMSWSVRLCGLANERHM